MYVEKAGVMGGAESGRETRESVGRVALDSAGDRRKGHDGTSLPPNPVPMRIVAM
jgi:hypothetical protein